MKWNDIKLKRLKQNIEEFPLKMLNNKPNNISKRKWKDLCKLGTCDIPVVKNPDHKLFFMNLPHDDQITNTASVMTINVSSKFNFIL